MLYNRVLKSYQGSKHTLELQYLNGVVLVHNRTDAIAELRLGKINLLAAGKMRWESERLWAETPRRELGEVPLGSTEGLSRRGGMRRWARGLPSMAGTAHGALLLPEAALRGALWGVADERKPGTAAHPATPALGPRSAGCTRLPRPTPPPPSGPEGSGAGCSAWWLVAWPRAGNARGAVWRGDLRSYRGPRGGGGPARSWGCTAVGRGRFMLSGHPAPRLNKQWGGC